MNHEKKLLEHLLNGKIYVIGGSDENGITDSVDYYDPKTDEWGVTMPLPEPRDHIGVATFNGKLYAVGGFDQADIPTDQLLIYDPEIDEWQEGKSMPTARGALATGFINGTLYAVGGVDSTHNVVSTNEAYDPETDTWTERSPMPTARHHLASSVVDGKLYAIGGRLLGNGIPRPVNEALSNFNDNEAYDPKQDSWTNIITNANKKKWAERLLRLILKSIPLEVKVLMELSTTMKDTTLKGMCGPPTYLCRRHASDWNLYQLKIKFMFLVANRIWELLEQMKYFIPD